MDKICSFTIDHDILTPGLYISRSDANVITYDIRTRRPNVGNYMSNAVMHTIEHMFATYVRNSSYADKVIYFGPMGCRTGFYFLMLDTVGPTEVISLVREAFDYIRNHTGNVPGAERKECGNYLEHDLQGAKEEAESMLTVLADYDESNMVYPK